MHRTSQEAAKAQRAALESAKAALEGSVAALGQEIAAVKQAVGDLEVDAADVEDKAKAVNLSSREQVRGRGRRRWVATCDLKKKMCLSRHGETGAPRSARAEPVREHHGHPLEVRRRGEPAPRPRL